LRERTGNTGSGWGSGSWFVLFSDRLLETLDARELPETASERPGRIVRLVSMGYRLKLVRLQRGMQGKMRSDTGTLPQKLPTGGQKL
jgi:hypothetical protein